MQPDEILAVRGLSLSFPTFGGFTPVLHDVSFSVKKGETLAIVGESGSGKTVTMRRVMHLLHNVRTDAGEITLRKKDGSVLDITHLSNSEAREIRGVDLSMVFQEPMTSLNPLFTIGNQLEEAILSHQDLPRSEAARKSLELLEIARIPDAKKRSSEYPHQMSGGMRQRVMIAMALACRPQVLIADEPTTALDVTIQAQILALIRSLQKQFDMAVVFITHDMGVVAELAERVIVMYQGRIVETNDVYTLFGNPSHPYTRALLKAVPRLGCMRGRKNPATLPVLDMESELKRGAGAALPREKEIDTADYGKNTGPGSPQPDHPLRVQENVFRPAHSPGLRRGKRELPAVPGGDPRDRGRVRVRENNGRLLGAQAGPRDRGRCFSTARMS